MGNLLMAKDLIVTWWIGFSDGSSSLPIENAPPGIETIPGANCAGIGAVTGAAAALFLMLCLALSCGACAGADAGEPPFGFSSGSCAGAGVGNGGGVLAVTAGDSVLAATVGA